jgi:hypothetical protein
LLLSLPLLADQRFSESKKSAPSALKPALFLTLLPQRRCPQTPFAAHRP